MRWLVLGPGEEEQVGDALRRLYDPSRQDSFLNQWFQSGWSIFYGEGLLREDDHLEHLERTEAGVEVFRWRSITGEDICKIVAELRQVHAATAYPCAKLME